ncbi:arachidonate 15-lipoxygenase [Allohahella marinimesophila]|uniref:Arachidonate 15-lipoxygenase n=2 Tax=Allohahella marinimesophila TaxID=1054972 RepID=A0ABP7Q1P8_9GAMM
MIDASSSNPVPSLPQNDTPTAQAQRAFQLSLARTSYNYMQSYLEHVPLSAGVPKGEEFSLAYTAKVLPVFLRLAANFKGVVLGILAEELEGDLPTEAIRDVEKAWDKLEDNLSIFHPERDLENLKGLLGSLSKVPRALEGMVRIPGDLERMATGLNLVFEELLREGPTALLKSTLFNMLDRDGERDYLQATGIADYRKLFELLPAPQTLDIARQPWMKAKAEPYEQDWYFGYLQTAGFNTTILTGVRLDKDTPLYGTPLSSLIRKMPVTDGMLQSVTGNARLTLKAAARSKRLYVCDYAMLTEAKTDPNHGEERYVAAPIALFYLNDEPGPGYPDGGAALQPIAIQLQQTHDTESAPIFTPNDCANANDAKGLKWQLAKTLVNVACAMQHENVAHLGACHLTLDPMIVAAHRQLSEQHPLLQLLIPHFRFTLNINDNAIHSLVIPGGVVANTVGLKVESSLAMVAAARQTWRWDEQSPDKLFELRGVDASSLPEFAFRDDTLLLWTAIKRYVGSYLEVYYANDTAVANDTELQGFINELVSPKYADFKGLNGLKPSGDEQQPFVIDSLEYLTQIVSHIIYIAGPLHASVNYAQYPLMSFSPSVSGCIYNPLPARRTVISSKDKAVGWYPPLDIALYTLSFEYLLSGVQYDSFGQYSDDPRVPYFTDARVHEAVGNFQQDLALAEIEISQRNRSRAMPYTFQLPSMIPNSTSI